MVLLATLGCTADPSDKSSGALGTDGTLCPVFTTFAECRGETIAQVDVRNDLDHLIIRITGSGGFLIAGADIAAGIEFPATAGGDFDIPSFPFHYDYATALATAEIRIPLADMALQCDGQTLSIAVHVRAVRLDASGAVIDTKEGFAESGHAYGSGFCFYYDLCCAPPDVPEPDAGLPDDGHDAGVPDDEPDACTYTQGYYKNHPEDWPVTSLTIAGEVYTQAELLAIYRTSVRGDASISLAHQLITAMLNVENGAPAPAALAEAELFLTAHVDVDGRLPFGYVSGTPLHAEASRLNDLLAEFNEGRAGTLHCD